MSEMLISVPGISGSGSEATTIPIRGGEKIYVSYAASL